ncbi:MAG: Crp/Fnr family transcriptional regulator [Geminicoccaceae bacterium]
MSLPAGLRSQLLQQARLRSFPRGSWIYVQGDPPRGLWAVVEGEISFSKMAPGGHEVVYHVAGPGFWFGVFGVISGMPLNMAVTALNDVKLLFMPRRAVDEIVEREPRYALQLLRLTFTRASELIELVAQITRPSPRARVASRLLMLQATEAEHAVRQPVAVLRVSQFQLAAMTALSRQSVSRAVGELHAAGAIEPGFRQITILDADRLRQIADTAD